MNQVEILKKVFAPFKVAITQVTTFPYSTTKGTRLKIYNYDGINSVTLTLTFDDDSTMAIAVPAAGECEVNTPYFKSIEKSGSSTSFSAYIGVPE